MFAAFVVYLIAGHTYHPGETMDNAAVGAGICIVLVTAVSGFALVRPQQLARPFVPISAVAATLARISDVPNRRARASPTWLQRFLN